MMDAVLPYAGTSGWSGSEASYVRAVQADKAGVTSARQSQVLAFVLSRGEQGATFVEVGERFGFHHGTSSGVLSVLHKAGLLARLTVKRGKCQVYVHPDFIQGRDTARHGRLRKPCSNCGHVED